jgi:hypothetical protein
MLNALSEGKKLGWVVKNRLKVMRRLEDSALEALGRPYLKSLHRETLSSLENAEQAQDILWKKIRESLRGTQIYSDLALDSVESYSDYLKKVPANSYEFYAPYVERVKNGECDVLFSDDLNALVMTSGTSGFNDKLIPFNSALISSFQSFQRRLIGVVGNASNWHVSLSHNKLVLGANPAVDASFGVPKGYVSGVLATKSPKMLQRRVVPAPSTLAIENWDEKVSQIAHETASEDVRMLAGVPAHLASLFRDLLKTTGKSSLKDMWPNINSVIYSGTGVETYERTLNELAGKELQYIGMYVASEAPIAFEIPNENTKGTHEFVFALNETLLSFVPVDSPDDGKLLGVHELSAGVDYLVHIGSPNGFLQYAMRDVIRVQQTYPHVSFTIQGRQNQLLNIATEKVSVQQLSATIALVEQELSTSIPHFFVYPLQPKEGKAHYMWLLACDDIHNTKVLAENLDKYLMHASGDYQEERMDAKHIGAPRVRVLSPTMIREYFDKNRSRGQFKMKNVFASEAEFKKFVAVENINFLEQV